MHIPSETPPEDNIELDEAVNHDESRQILTDVETFSEARVNGQMVYIGDREYDIGQIIQALWYASDAIDLLANTIESAENTLREIYPISLHEGDSLDEMLGTLNELHP